MPRLLSIVGARPQFIKAAVLCHALKQWPQVTHVLVHTGQHHDVELSDIFFSDLGIPDPDHHLGVAGGSHGDMTGRMLIGIEPVVSYTAPDAVIVYGDTNSTLAGALVAVKLHLPVVHVEAGLRSFDRRMPEEVNRVLTDHVSEILLCPTRTAVANLGAEGIRSGVHHVGDVMYDLALKAAQRVKRDSDVLQRLDLAGRSFVILTLHRAENTASPARVAELLAYVQGEAGTRPIVFPVHPRTRDAICRFGLSLEGFITCPSLSYLDMVRLLTATDTVFTDSGGLQKEAYFHQVPCVTLRDTTEWVETVESGWNRLWQNETRLPRRAIDEYGEGNAAMRIVEVLRATYG